MKHKQIPNLFYYFNALAILFLMSAAPKAIGANANLFVSAENSQFDNYMSGPQVIEVVVIDSDINDTDEAKGEPDVTVNGKILRMVQAVDGNWYGYFADRNQVQMADSTVGLPGFGLDYGELCTSASVILGIDLSDTAGFAVPRDIDSGSNGLEALGVCDGNIAGSHPFINHVVRQPKDINNFNPNSFPSGQIGLNENAWPFIQLYHLNPTGNVVVQYNKGGGVQTTTLTFDTAQDFADLALDRNIYPRNSQVHVTITDLALNIDPTDEDSWTFGTNESTPMVVYQAFDENGAIDADGTAGAVNIYTLLEDLMFDDNGILFLDVGPQGDGMDVVDLFDTEDQEIIPGKRAADAVSIGGSFGPGTQPITITEQGPNSGVFSSTDEGDQSGLRVRADVMRGKSATIEYNDTPASILTGFDTATVDIQPVDTEWSSGEEIPVVLRDFDANKNSRADEDLDLFNPEVEAIPALQIGNPFTLETLESAQIDGAELVVDEVQPVSQRAMLRVSHSDLTLVDGSTLTLTLGDTFADLYASINDPSEASFSGFNFFNFDIRSIANAIDINSFNIELSDGVVATNLFDDNFQDLINLDSATGHSIFGMDVTAKVELIFTFNIEGNSIIPAGTVLPIVCDFFSFGKINDGAQPDERINNMIVRLELEETGDNTSVFEGSLEFTMLNQLNILDPDTYGGLSTIADDPTFIVSNGLYGDEAPKVSYFDTIVDGTTIVKFDQEEAPSHSGIVSFDLESYSLSDTVIVTLYDPDLGLDSDLVEIYTPVSPAFNPDDPAKDTIGEPGLGNYVTKPLGAFGRLLDITFNGQRWTSGLTENGGACGSAGIPDDGLFASTFALVESGTETGVFLGSFDLPSSFCNSSTGQLEAITSGTRIGVNYVDYTTAENRVMTVSDAANSITHTGAVSLDRTVYPVPFGTISDFFPGQAQSDAETPDGDSIFPVHHTGVVSDGDTNIDSASEEIGPGDVMVHVSVTDIDFDLSQGSKDVIAFGDHGPVKIMVRRGSETMVLATAGGVTPNSGVITTGPNVIPGVTRELGPIRETSHDSGKFELDLAVRYTDGPADRGCPDTPELGFSSLNGEGGVLGRFDQMPADGNYCLLTSDTLFVEYTDPADYLGNPKVLGASGFFNLSGAFLLADKTEYLIGSEMTLTLFEPDLNLDANQTETYNIDSFEWSSAAATLTIGDLGGELSFFPRPLRIREMGTNSGIFQMVLTIPESIHGTPLANREQITLEYTDWGLPSGGYVGNQSENKQVIFTAISPLSHVSFVSSSSMTSQESGLHSVQFQLEVVNGGVTVEDISVDVIEAGTGTATAGSDYTSFAPTTVLFPAGSIDGDTLEINIEILPDALNEGNETIDLQLANPAGPAIFGAQVSHQVTITDEAPSLMPIGHWKLDELSWSGVEDDVVDSSGQSHHGRAAGGANTVVNAKMNRAGKFDGDDDFIDLGMDKSGDSLQLTKGGTLTGWFMQEEGGDRWQRVFDKSTNHSGINGYALIIDPLDRSIWLGVNGSLYRSNAQVYEFNQWTHVTAVITATDFRIYVDGLEVPGKFQSGHAKLPPNVTSTMRIGSWNHATGREFRGLLDDLRIYDRVLTLLEIEELLVEASASTTFVAHYKLDEGDGCVAMDSQGDHQGDLQPGCPVDSPSWTAGRAGGALEFDGDNDLIDLGVIELGDPLQLTSGGTMIGWFQQRPGDRWQRMFDKSSNHSGINGYALMVDPKDHSIWIGVNGSLYKSNPKIYEFDKWTHVAAVITESEFTVYVNGVKIPGRFVTGQAQLPPDVATGMRIGSWNHASKREFNGFLDDLRIYSSELNASEIQTIFQESKIIAGLIGHYALDEGTGCTTADNAGGSSPKEGHLAPNCSQNTNDGPAWSTEAILGHALEFDGDNDLVKLGMIETGHPFQLAAGGTITGWFNQRPGDRWQRILDKSTDPSGASGYALMVDPIDRSIWIGVNGSLYKSDPEVYTFNVWTHVSALITESAFAIYVNGAEVGGRFVAGKIQLPPDIATEMRIGSWNHATRREFNGFLDDLRIYSRALSASEINEIYDEGSLNNDLIAQKAVNSDIPKAKFSRSAVSAFNSQTVYEDAEDGTIDRWLAYGDGSVINVEDTSGNRIIATTGDLLGDPFRLGLDNQEDWNNMEEFTATFAILLEEAAAVYFRIDTTEGEKYLCYQPGDGTIEISNNVICFGLGIQVDGQWHTIIRDLEIDLERALPGTHLLSVKDFYVYGSVKLDNLMLLKQSAD